jgi:D-alanyl-D-alanine carboxypeptidase
LKRNDETFEVETPSIEFFNTKLLWGPNTIYFHGGETAGYNSILGYDPRNQLTLVMWSNLTVSLDPHFEGLDQVYVVSPLSPSP